MRTKLIQLSAIATVALAGPLIAADQSPAPSAPPSSSPTDTRNPTNPSSPAAAPGSAASSAAAKATAAGMNFQGKITSVDKENKTVTIQDASGTSKTLHIGDTTKISRGATSTDPANWEDLKVGSQISGTHKMQGSMTHAETVTISSTGEAK